MGKTVNKRKPGTQKNKKRKISEQKISISHDVSLNK